MPLYTGPAHSSNSLVIEWQGLDGRFLIVGFLVIRPQRLGHHVAHVQERLEHRGAFLTIYGIESNII